MSEFLTQKVFDRLFKKVFEFREKNGGKFVELCGRVLFDGTIFIAGFGTEEEALMCPPPAEKCLAHWHVHPPLTVLENPVEDVLFSPPSNGDAFMAIIAFITNRMRESVIISPEGLYIIHRPIEAVLRKFEAELRPILESEEEGAPFLYPGEPIMMESGLNYFDFHGEESNFPLSAKLLGHKQSFAFDSLEEAQSATFNAYAEMGIRISHVPMKRKFML